MNSTQIGGTKLNADLLSIFWDTVTILSCVETNDAYGTPVQTWTEKTGQTDIPAFVGPIDVGHRLRPQEQRTAEMTRIDAQRHVTLNGDYTVDQKDRCRWNGFDWNIRSVVNDETATFTNLLIEEVVPGNV